MEIAQDGTISVQINITTKTVAFVTKVLEILIHSFYDRKSVHPDETSVSHLLGS
jgi:hypothetical protein